MTAAEKLAAFAAEASFDKLSAEVRRELKIRVLDALGCALGAVEGKPVLILREQIEDLGAPGPATLIGGGRASPEQAALHNSALVRYLDFNDSYLAPGETCHPSDNLGSVLAAAEYADRGGMDFLTALAVAYQVQCRLSDEAPVRARGFDHTTQGAYALAAGVSRALGLNPGRTANAIAICGTACNALRVTRTGALSHWKGLAYPFTGYCCTYATLLAGRGITGPAEVFEGNKGFMETVSGRFEIDWVREGLERPLRTIVKKFNAEIHSQSVLEGILELAGSYGFQAAQVEQVRVEVFDVAYHIIGGGEEGDKREVRTKEEADHSLPYLAAVAILDREVTPRQYAPARIESDDVQALLHRVRILPHEEFSRRFPAEMPCRISIRLRGGHELVLEKRDYEGFHTRPMSWEVVVRKFDSLSQPYAGESLRREIVQAVHEIESIRVRDLTRLLAEVRIPAKTAPVPPRARAVSLAKGDADHAA
jgi:2-methylcitrate dehydratase